MNTTLCFDFGNTRLKCGVFTNGSLVEVIVMKDNEDNTIEALLIKYQPSKTILSSVVHHNRNIEKILSAKSDFQLLNEQTKMPCSVVVDKPETVGPDRLALAAAAVFFYKEQNVLVVSSGSCITYNFINRYGSFLGGSISPGMDMRFKSMNAYTAKLPLVKMDTDVAAFNFPLIGYNTKSNMVSGVILGIAFEMDGVINAYREKFEQLQVIITGGNISCFLPHIKNAVTVDEDLIFKGLYAISESN